MRCYTFNHFMFRDLCKGIQSNHACVEIPLKYSADTLEGVALQCTHDNWARNHKTLIYLAGGDSAGLHGVCETLQELGVDSNVDFGLPMPWASFNEDERTLEGILTAVAIVVHPHYYCAAAAKRSGGYRSEFWNLSTEFRKDLIEDCAKYEKFDRLDTTFVAYSEKEQAFVDFLSGFSLA